MISSSDQFLWQMSASSQFLKAPAAGAAAAAGALSPPLLDGLSPPVPTPCTIASTTSSSTVTQQPEFLLPFLIYQLGHHPDMPQVWMMPQVCML